MTELHYIKFRFMVGKCQLDALFFNKRVPYSEISVKEDTIDTSGIQSEEMSTTITPEDLETVPINSHEFTRDKDPVNVTEETTTQTSTKLDSRLPLIFPGKRRVFFFVIMK